mmetsp:Transcript_2919/g.8431  ORF Transcript_2919/g.8431 Transcript_2919/m.8431 type:complete len:222 (+) Transcript_2919:1076-1741(+)
MAGHPRTREGIGADGDAGRARRSHRRSAPVRQRLDAPWRRRLRRRRLAPRAQRGAPRRRGHDVGGARRQVLLLLHRRHGVPREVMPEGVLGRRRRDVDVGRPALDVADGRELLHRHGVRGGGDHAVRGLPVVLHGGTVGSPRARLLRVVHGVCRVCVALMGGAGHCGWRQSSTGERRAVRPRRHGAAERASPQRGHALASSVHRAQSALAQSAHRRRHVRR